LNIGINTMNPKPTDCKQELELALLTDYLAETYTLTEIKLAASALNTSATSFYAEFNTSRAKLGRLNRMKAKLEVAITSTNLWADIVKLHNLKVSIKEIKITHSSGLCAELMGRSQAYYINSLGLAWQDRIVRIRIQRKLLSLMFLTWVSYSGELSYPIVGGSSAFHYHLDNHSLYPIDKETISPYSRLRIKLLNHIINTTAFITRPACKDIKQLTVIKSSTNTYKHSKKV
jgi:hypothetical protein